LNRVGQSKFVTVQGSDYDSRAPEEVLGEGLKSMGLQVSVAQRQLLMEFLQLLAKWNQSYNLTAVRDLRQMVVRHVLDSLSISALLVGTRILDVGSGAGLPGLVLAITQPDRHFVLLDSALKRTRFLHQAAYELGLKNVEIERQRIEKFTPQTSFDCMLSRASFPLQSLLDASRGLLCKDGVLLAMQGKLPEQACTFTRQGVVFEQLTVAGMDAHRHVAIYHHRP